MKISFTVFGNDPLGFPQSCFTTLNLLNSGGSAWDTFSFSQTTTSIQKAHKRTRTILIYKKYQLFVCYPIF